MLQEEMDMMGFFKNKEHMFNHRAERFDKEAEQYSERGDTENDMLDSTTHTPSDDE